MGSEVPPSIRRVELEEHLVQGDSAGVRMGLDARGGHREQRCAAGVREAEHVGFEREHAKPV